MDRIRGFQFPILCFLILSVLGFSACGRMDLRKVPEAKTRTAFGLDTVVSITYYDEKDRASVDRAIGSLDHYSKIFSRKDPESELSAVNRSRGIAIPVSEDLFNVLKTAWDLSAKTDGAFDCTLGALSDLYGFTGERHVPSDEERNELLSHAGYEKVVLDEENRTVTRLDAGAVIDLGAIAKGYIADKLKEELLNAGVRRAIVNLGGNVQLIGNKYGESGEVFSTGAADGLFTIGIKNPDSETPLTKLYLADLSVVTSGTYERCFYDEGVLYHHILDAETGLPVRNGLLSVSIVSRESMKADALSTALFVLGEEGAEKLLLNDPDVRAIFAYEDGRLSTVRPASPD